MRFIRVVAVLLLLGVCSNVLAASITDVAITSVVHDQKAHTVVVTITNNSGKDVTAFTLSLRETVSGEVQQSQVTRDFLHNAAVLDQVKGTADEARVEAQVGPASLPSGQSYQEKLGASSFLTNVEAVLSVVAFSDKTAETTDPAALQRLIDARKANAATIQKVRETVSDTLADAAVKSPRAAAHDKVQGAMNAWEAQPHTSNPDLSVTQFHIIEQHLRQLPAGDETENLKSYMNVKSREQAMWLDQAQLVQTGARP